MIVALNVKLARLIAAHANKKGRCQINKIFRYATSASKFLPELILLNEEARQECVFLLVKMQMFNFYRGLGCARGDESIIYFPTIYAC